MVVVGLVVAELVVEDAEADSNTEQRVLQTNTRIVSLSQSACAVTTRTHARTHVSPPVNDSTNSRSDRQGHRHNSLLCHCHSFGFYQSSVRHETLVRKLVHVAYNIPDSVYNWVVGGLVDYFGGRIHCTKFSRLTSALSPITARVIQLGRPLLLLMQPVSHQSQQEIRWPAKYDDDT